VIVIGAGVIGCAVAAELARRGAAVQIVDDRPPGMGATQASAGVLAPYIEAREGGPLLELTARSLDMFDAFIERTRMDSGVVVPYHRTGTLDVARTKGSMEALSATADLLEGRGIDARMLDADQVRTEEPQLSTDAIGGLMIRTHGFVAAGELTTALLAAARAHGVVRLETGRARRVAQAGTGLIVEAGPNAFHADAVVVAAGSWTGQIEVEGAEGPLPVRPVRGQLLQLTWCGALLGRVIWGEHCYMVPWRDGTVLVGATVEEVGFDERTTVAGLRDLMAAACELVPAARNASLVAAKVGLRPACPDRLPAIGPSAVMPNLVYASGHYRNGILLAPLTAALVADAVLEGTRDPLLELTRPQRFGQL
jgi:glycine oxidase